MNLLERRCWIFDMDGTLTVPIHDFDAIRAELELPPGRPVLELLAELAPARARALEQRLEEIELDLARRSRAQPGVADFLAARLARGAHLGILTRNSRRNALVTLRACELEQYFDPEDILTREDIEPKPSPAGILELLERWGATPEQAVIAGDFRFDLEAGRAAGVPTVYVDPSGAFEWARFADVMVRRLDELC